MQGDRTPSSKHSLELMASKMWESLVKNIMTIVWKKMQELNHLRFTFSCNGFCAPVALSDPIGIVVAWSGSLSETLY